MKGALHPHFSEPVIRLCQTFPFSIICDESNKGDKKHFSIFVCMLDNIIGRPVTRFLDMPVCNIATASKLFDCIDSLFEFKNIPWSNVVGFESDTCNVMMGRHNSVLHLLSSSVFMANLSCMLATTFSSLSFLSNSS